MPSSPAAAKWVDDIHTPSRSPGSGIDSTWRRATGFTAGWGSVIGRAAWDGRGTVGAASNLRGRERCRKRSYSKFHPEAPEGPENSSLFLWSLWFLCVKHSVYNAAESLTRAFAKCIPYPLSRLDPARPSRPADP